MKDWIAKGYDIIALVPSCALMLKFEWPLILPDDPNVASLSKATFDISEYVVDIAKKEGLAPGLAPTPATMTVHMACHARAQNMGQKAAEMLRLVPQASVKVIVVFTRSGNSARLISEDRPRTPILAYTPSERVYRQLALSGGESGQTALKCKAPRTR